MVHGWKTGLRVLLGLACVAHGGTPSRAESVVIDVSAGTSFNRAVIGQNVSRGWPEAYDSLELAYRSSMRGPAGGLGADCYDWRDLMSGDLNREPWFPTLQTMRDARDRGSEVLLTANTRGSGRSPYPLALWDCAANTWPASQLATLASDWVRYTNSILQTYRQGDTISSPSDSVLLSSLSWMSFDKLLARTEASVDKVTYWEIGNEPEIGGIDGALINHYMTPADYASRYHAITQAMVATDPSIAVGPCVCILPSSHLNTVLANPAAQVDFVAYHPYYNSLLWAYQSGSATSVESALRGLKAFNQTQKSYVVNALTAYGRSSTTPLMATEWNSMSCFAEATAAGNSVAHALGNVETVFNFIELGLRAAHYFNDPYDSKPGFRVFEAMQDHIGNTLLYSYTDGASFRLYATRDSATGDVAVWGLNFSDSQNKTVQLNLRNLTGQISDVRLMKLAGVSGGDTSLMQTGESVGWLETDLTGQIDLSSFPLTFEDATLSVLIIKSAQSPGETQSFASNPGDWTSRTATDGAYTETAAWSATATAGAATGEARAKFYRLTTSDPLNACVSWYADTDLNGRLDVGALRVLKATGSFCVNDFTSSPDLGTGVWIGWFQPLGACRMGIMLNDNTGAGAGWYAGIVDASGAVVAQTYMGSVAKGIKYSFEIEFDNLEGEYHRGRLIAKITPAGGATEQCVIHLTQPLTSYEFTAFGLTRPNPNPTPYPAWNSKSLEVSLDDLTYTANAWVARQESQDFASPQCEWQGRAASYGSYQEAASWSNTSLAGGALGEGHGKFHRIRTTDASNANTSYYADLDLGEPLDAAKGPLRASGRFCIAGFTPTPDMGNGVWLGWFKPNGPCRIGIMLNDNVSGGLGWYAGIVLSTGTVVGYRYGGTLAAGVGHTFQIEFDNSGGVFGKGRLLVRIRPGSLGVQTAMVDLTNYLSRYDLTAFGLSRPNPSSVYKPGTMIDLYLDDVLYSSSDLNTTPLAAAKYQQDGTSAAVSGIVTAVFGDHFYVESEDRVSGLRVNRLSSGLVVGQEVTVSGLITTLPSTERCLNATLLKPGGSSVDLAPLAMTNKAIGDAVGLDTIGLLVRATGVVHRVSDSEFTIDDGSGVHIRVVHASGGAPADGSYAIVTGVVSCEKELSTGRIWRLLKTRSSEDAQAVSR